MRIPRTFEQRLQQMGKNRLIKVIKKLRQQLEHHEEDMRQLSNFIEALERKGKLPGLLLPVKAITERSDNLPKGIEEQYIKEFKKRDKKLMKVLSSALGKNK